MKINKRGKREFEIGDLFIVKIKRNIDARQTSFVHPGDIVLVIDISVNVYKTLVLLTAQGITETYEPYDNDIFWIEYLP